VERGQFAHYCVVRADLPNGFQKAQLQHASGESASEWTLLNGRRLPAHTFAVTLWARDEAHLREISLNLATSGIKHNLIVETDAPYSGSMTALGVLPMDRSVVGPLLSSLPLAK
jgi:Peptidyl-tRNA hydrolase PTH2